MSFIFQKKLFGSIAFRVLFTSFVFLIAPLIFYSAIIYNQNYQEKLHDVFQEMEIFQKDQINFIFQIQENTLNFLDAFRQTIPLVEDRPALEPVLNDFAKRGNLSAVFHLTQTAEGKLVCTNSTLPAYLNIDFTPYFDLKKLTNTFIGKDPIFNYSLFFAFAVNDGVIGASIGLNDLLASLMELRHIYKANLSILKLNGEIIASSDPDRIGKKFLEATDLKTHHDPSIIPAKRVHSVNHGFEFYLDKEKRFLTFARIPYTDTDLALTIPTNVVLTKLYKSLSELATLLAFILIVGGLISYLLTLRFAKPLAKLSVVMDKVGDGHLDERFQKDPMGFEINFLGEKFNAMVVSLINYIEEVKRERASKEAYLKELQIGHEIQQSILPEGNIQFQGIQAATYFQSAKEVAGDFYDWLIKDDTILLAIADGVGKGISACLYSFGLRSAIRAFGTLTNDLPDIAKKTNAIFCQDTKETGNFVTAFLASYHAKTRQLSYINCGHNYPIVKRANGSVEKLEVHGLAFGIEEFETIEMKQTTLNPGDTVIFYTDGLTDAQNSERQLFGEKRFLETITNCPLTATPDEIIQILLREITLFTEGEEQFDDMTLLIFKTI